MEHTLLAKPQRIYSIDLLRGIIMVIMALDHVRDYFSNAHFDLTDLTRTTPALFFTRWITHFCAPVFVFLAGTSAYLSQTAKGKTKKQASLFLLSRGLWLIVLEVTVVRTLWTFNFDIGFQIVQVIWAIGFSMVFLAALVYLKPLYVGIIGLVIIVIHNSFDGIASSSFGSFNWFWMFLHEQNLYGTPERGIIFGYPIIPWIGVMAAGYWFGTFFKLESEQRKKLFLKIGFACIGLFILIRTTNLYGDRSLWHQQDSLWKTIASFVNCTKYPPSLLYLLMTLGPAIVALSLLEKANNKGLGAFFIVYGRVPMFYYLWHIFLAHGLAILVAYITGYPDTARFFSNNVFFSQGPWGFDLWFVYFIWITVVLILYYPCKWFMNVKARNKHWSLSYI
jgi:uncharacterized membrane protein